MTGKMNLRDKLDDDTLDLSLMDLETVPVKEIAAIKRFSHLDLSNNALMSLPKNFSTLTQIVKLDLSKNMLTDLPDNFGELKNLKHLDLYSNQISRLPLSLGDLKNLKWLDLKENPLTPAVASVAGPCSNSAECQACARNIVAYLANAKVTIQEEKQRRIESLPAEDSKKSPKAKRGRKKKSVERKMTEKAKVDSTDEEKQENNKNSDQKTSSRNSSMSLESQGGIFSSLCQVFISIILWSFFFFLLTTIAIIVLPLFDEKRSNETFKFIEGHTGVPIKTLRYKFILSVGALADNMKAYTNHAREFVVKFYKQYFMSSSSPRSIKS